MAICPSATILVPQAVLSISEARALLSQPVQSAVAWRGDNVVGLANLVYIMSKKPRSTRYLVLVSGEVHERAVRYVNKLVASPQVTVIFHGKPKLPSTVKHCIDYWLCSSAARPEPFDATRHAVPRAPKKWSTPAQQHLAAMGFSPARGENVEWPDVKRRYRELVLQLHPDKKGGGGSDDQQSVARFMEVQEAYRALQELMMHH